MRALEPCIVDPRVRTTQSLWHSLFAALMRGLWYPAASSRRLRDHLHADYVRTHVELEALLRELFDFSGVLFVELQRLRA